MIIHMVLFITILALAIILFMIIISWTIHRSQCKESFYERKNINKNNSFLEFKKNFYKHQWKRDISNKFSLFPLSYSEYNDNYIHAGIVKVDGVAYIFTFFSYLRFLIFFNFKIKKTNHKNLNIIINTKRGIRKEKLKNLK